MATDPQVLNDGTDTHNYSLVSLTGSEAVYREEDSSMSEPWTLRIAHTASKISSGTDRHLVQLNRVVEDTDEETTPYTGSVHVVIAGPRKAVTEAMLLEEWNKLSSFIDAEFSELLGGFMP